MLSHPAHLRLAGVGLASRNRFGGHGSRQQSEAGMSTGEWIGSKEGLPQHSAWVRGMSWGKDAGNIIVVIGLRDSPA